MARANRSEKILKDIQRVNLRVDTFINEVTHNMTKTNKELNKRKKARR